MQARHPRSPLVNLSIAPSGAGRSARGTSRSPSQAKQLGSIGRESISFHWKRTSDRARREILGTTTADIHGSAIHLDLKTRASLVRAIARSRVWLNAILSERLDIEAIALREARTIRSIQLMLPLAFIAPTNRHGRSRGEITFRVRTASVVRCIDPLGEAMGNTRNLVAGAPFRGLAAFCPVCVHKRNLGRGLKADLPLCA
jgi:hypothetical protein